MAKKIVVCKDGPYLVSGNVDLSKETIGTDDEGNSVEYIKGKKYPQKENYSLCRCGKSKNNPYCDGSHAETAFDGTETASKEKFSEQADVIEGKEIVLQDVYELCANARFCHNKKGRVWELTRDGTNDKEAISQACNCPSGRLVMSNRKTGKQIEPELKQEISLIEDPAKNVSGPIWVKGGIPVESEEKGKYEKRNRVTLCRCGKSRNKPFCDASHIEAGFKAEE